MGPLLKRTLEHRRAAIVAVALALLLLVGVGTFEAGLAYQTWQLLPSAARESVRIAVVSGSTEVTVRYPFDFITVRPVARLVEPGGALESPMVMAASAMMRNE